MVALSRWKVGNLRLGGDRLFLTTLHALADGFFGTRDQRMKKTAPPAMLSG
jgi:hypothetical protein